MNQSERIPITNPGPGSMWVAGQMIPSGETRHFPLHHVPPEHRPVAKPAASLADDAEAAQAAQAARLAEILSGTVATVSEQLADLDAEDLAALAVAEEAGANRKGVLEAIDAERLRRAAAGAR